MEVAPRLRLSPPEVFRRLGSWHMAAGAREERERGGRQASDPVRLSARPPWGRSPHRYFFNPLLFLYYFSFFFFFERITQTTCHHLPTYLHPKHGTDHLTTIPAVFGPCLHRPPPSFGFGRRRHKQAKSKTVDRRIVLASHIPTSQFVKYHRRRNWRRALARPLAEGGLQQAAEEESKTTGQAVFSIHFAAPLHKPLPATTPDQTSSLLQSPDLQASQPCCPRLKPLPASILLPLPPARNPTPPSSGFSHARRHTPDDNPHLTATATPTTQT
jgi:hypothetical protein